MVSKGWTLSIDNHDIYISHFQWYKHDFSIWKMSNVIVQDLYFNTLFLELRWVMREKNSQSCRQFLQMFDFKMQISQKRSILKHFLIHYSVMAQTNEKIL